LPVWSYTTNAYMYNQSVIAIGNSLNTYLKSPHLAGVGELPVVNQTWTLASTNLILDWSNGTLTNVFNSTEDSLARFNISSDLLTFPNQTWTAIIANLSRAYKNMTVSNSSIVINNLCLNVASYFPAIVLSFGQTRQENGSTQ